MKSALFSDKALAPVGPYSQAVVSGSLVFVSGQLGVNPVDRKLGDTVEEQTRLALTGMSCILTEAGADMNDVVKTTILLSNMNDFTAMNGVYAEFFKEPYPARAAYQVVKLPLNAMVEIEAVARLKER